MRVCSPQLGVSPVSILGGEIYDRELLVELGALDNAIEVILPLGKLYPKVKNWRVTYMSFPFMVPPHVFNFLVIPYLLYIYKRRPFDILRIHSLAFLGIAALWFKKIYPRVPIVGINHWLGEGGKIEFWLLPHLVSRLDAIVCDSHHTQQELIKLFPQYRNKFHAIHNGVDKVLHPLPQSEKIRKHYGLSKTENTLLFMGLFIERKNPLFLVQIVQKLRKNEIDVMLIMCGKGPLEAEIKYKAQQSGIENYVQIVPPVFGEEKNQLLNSATIFVHPALNEGFSLSVIEAMAVGLPVVITRGYSASEAVAGENGFLCNSEKEWLEAIEKLTKNTLLRERMVKNNIKKVKAQFTWEKAAKKHHALFQKLIAGNINTITS